MKFNKSLISLPQPTGEGFWLEIFQPEFTSHLMSVVCLLRMIYNKDKNW